MPWRLQGSNREPGSEGAREQGAREEEENRVPSSFSPTATGIHMDWLVDEHKRPRCRRTYDHLLYLLIQLTCLSRYHSPSPAPRTRLIPVQLHMGTQ